MSDSATKRRCLPRFGLRSLLVLVTLLGIGLAYVGNEWHRLKKQRQIVAQIRAVGGRATYDYQFITEKELSFASNPDESNRWIEEYTSIDDLDEGPRSRYRRDEEGRVVDRQFQTPPASWLFRRILGEDAFSYVETVSFAFADDPVGWVDPQFFTELPRLKVIVLRGSQVNDEWIGLASEVPKLRGLALYGDATSTATASGLSRLSAAKNLESLQLGGEWLHDATLTGVAGLRQLRYLRVGRSPDISSAVFANLERLTELRELVILDARKIDDNGAEQLRRLHELRLLWLRGTSVTDATAEHVAELGNLEWLELDDAKLSDAGVMRLATLTRLKRLNVARNEITDAAVVSISQMPQLHTLCVSGSGVTDASMPALARMCGLLRLRLYPSTITDEGLSQLQQLTQLKELTIGPHVSDPAITKFSNSLPQCLVFPVNSE